MSSQYYSATAYVGTPHRNAVEVTIPLVGPQGPAGEAGAGAVESVNGQTGVVVLAAADVGAVASNDARLTDARTPTSHTHGNLSNAGAIGTTANLPVKTGTSGVLEAGAFGTAAGQFAEGNHTHAASAITSGVLDLARQKVVELVPCDEDPGNELAVSDYEQNGNIVAHFNLRPDAVGSHMSVVLPILVPTAIGEVTLRVNRGGQGLQFTSVLLRVLDEADGQIFGTSGGPTEIDADRELTFRWNDGRWDMDLRPNPSATTTAFSIFKPNASGTLALTSDIPSGGSKTYAVFTATDNQPPATAFATLDTRNSIAVLDFDDTTDESAVFVSIIPEGASLGSGLKIRLHWMSTNQTSNNVVWDVSLERMTTDLDADSFDTIASGTAAANTTQSGILTVTEITLTTIDSVTAGDGFRLKVTRDANNASDTMTGDAELVVCEVRSAA
jgi:hypothetical protein